MKSTAGTFDDALNLFDVEALAHARMSHMAWEYINTGAADEITARWNRTAFDQIRLMPERWWTSARWIHESSSLARSFHFPSCWLRLRCTNSYILRAKSRRPGVPEQPEQ